MVSRRRGRMDARKYWRLPRSLKSKVLVEYSRSIASVYLQQTSDQENWNVEIGRRCPTYTRRQLRSNGSRLLAGRSCLVLQSDHSSRARCMSPYIHVRQLRYNPFFLPHFFFFIPFPSPPPINPTCKILPPTTNPHILSRISAGNLNKNDRPLPFPLFLLTSLPFPSYSKHTDSARDLAGKGGGASTGS